MEFEPIVELRYGSLPTAIYENNENMGRAAAHAARALLLDAIEQRGNANIILATGNSTLSFLHALREFSDIPWNRVSVFHMDEYVGIGPEHPAGFSRFLHRHFLDFLEVAAFYPIPSQPADLHAACRAYAELLRQHPADLVAMGFGENGHIAFNDPPFADFDDPLWVKVVDLAEASRRQQVGEGHFAALDEVPRRAITLTIPALLAPRQLLVIVPEARKANAVRRCLTEGVNQDCPGSILTTVHNAQLFLDRESSSLIWR